MWAGISDIINYPSFAMRARTAAAATAAVAVEQRSTSASWVAMSRARQPAPQPSLLVVINLSYSPALCCYANTVPSASPVRQPRNSLPFSVRRLHSRLLIFRFLPLHRRHPRVHRPHRPAGPRPPGYSLLPSLPRL